MLRLLLALFCCSMLQAQQPDSLRFCAYNVRNWLLMQRGGEKGTLTAKPAKEKKLVIEHIIDIQPDVLGLSEIGTEDDALQIQHLLRQAGLDLPHMERCHGRDGTRSLLLLSRYPFVARLSHTELPYRIGKLDLGMQRGVLHVVIQPTPQLRLHLLGVHLKSKRPIPEVDEALMRKNEFMLLRRVIDDVLQAEPGAHILTYGDFNEHRGENTFKQFLGSRHNRQLMLQDVYLKDRNGEVWTHFWDSMDIYSRLDYLVITPSLRLYLDYKQTYIYHREDVLQASDHRPLVLQLKFTPKRTR
jgi:endonuclease/exonuclease/phosphatase family metal-dependent hydrolase